MSAPIALCSSFAPLFASCDRPSRSIGSSTSVASDENIAETRVDPLRFSSSSGPRRDRRDQRLVGHLVARQIPAQRAGKIAWTTSLTSCRRALDRLDFVQGDVREGELAVRRDRGVEEVRGARSGAASPARPCRGARAKPRTPRTSREPSRTSGAGVCGRATSARTISSMSLGFRSGFHVSRRRCGASPRAPGRRSAP